LGDGSWEIACALGAIFRVRAPIFQLLSSSFRAAGAIFHLRSSIFRRDDIVELREAAEIAVVFERRFQKREGSAKEGLVALLGFADAVELAEVGDADGEVGGHRSEVGGQRSEVRGQGGPLSIAFRSRPDPGDSPTLL